MHRIEATISACHPRGRSGKHSKRNERGKGEEGEIRGNLCNDFLKGCKNRYCNWKAAHVTHDTHYYYFVRLLWQPQKTGSHPKAEDFMGTEQISDTGLPAFSDTDYSDTVRSSPLTVTLF